MDPRGSRIQGRAFICHCFVPATSTFSTKVRETSGLQLKGASEAFAGKDQHAHKGAAACLPRVLKALQKHLQLMLGQYTLYILNGYCLSICPIGPGHHDRFVTRGQEILRHVIMQGATAKAVG